MDAVAGPVLVGHSGRTMAALGQARDGPVPRRADAPPMAAREVEAPGWAAAAFADSATYAGLPGALVVLCVLARMASRAAKIGLVAAPRRRRRPLVMHLATDPPAS